MHCFFEVADIELRKVERRRQTMHLAYCDDEEIQLEYIGNMIKTWAKKTGSEVCYSAYRSAEELLFIHEGNYPFDLLLLDIDMKGMDGMALAREIRKKDTGLPIVFLTNRREYVFEGYEVAALRYVLKPLTEEKLYPLLSELSDRKSEEGRYLIETIAGEPRKIDLKRLMYVEAEGHYLTLNRDQKRSQRAEVQFLRLKKSLAVFEKTLADAGSTGMFVATHRSFLVNLSYVERVLRTDCILSDGSSIPISRNCYKAVNEAFIAFYKK